MAEVFALKAIDHDNVATVFTNDVKAGMIANVADKKGHHFEIQLLSDVPYGHKIALCDIKKGEEIIKYASVRPVRVASMPMATLHRVWPG